jgi:hypothetical protein
VDIKEFGIDKIVQPLIYDLKILETDGIKTIRTGHEGHFMLHLWGYIVI